MTFGQTNDPGIACLTTGLGETAPSVMRLAIWLAETIPSATCLTIRHREGAPGVRCLTAWGRGAGRSACGMLLSCGLIVACRLSACRAGYDAWVSRVERLEIRAEGLRDIPESLRAEGLIIFI